MKLFQGMSFALVYSKGMSIASGALIRLAGAVDGSSTPTPPPCTRSSQGGLVPLK
jgi:hypothetical protein